MMFRILGIVAISMLQTISIVIMWRGRMHHWALAQSDTVTFLVPLFSSYLVNLLLAWPLECPWGATRGVVHLATAGSIAMLPVAISQGVAILICLNVYGS